MSDPRIEFSQGMHPERCDCGMDFGEGKHSGQALSREQRVVHCVAILGLSMNVKDLWL